MEMPEIRVTDSKVIKVKYATLPVTTTAFDVMVQIMEPMAFIPEKVSISHNEYVHSGSIEDVLKGIVLNNWKDKFETVKDNEHIQRFLDIETVELIECDLLVPKDK